MIERSFALNLGEVEEEVGFTVAGPKDKVTEFIVSVVQMAEQIEKAVKNDAIPITTASPCGCGDCE
jgi:hypothetical protein